MFLDIDGAPIYADSSGEGPDALFLHGVPDSADIWQKLIPLVRHQYRCYVTDLPGIHRSGIPGGFEFDLDGYADHIDKVVSGLNLTLPITLVIHDWGGIYGMLWACKYPDKVKSIVGGNFPFSHLYKWHEWASVWRTPVIGELSMWLMNWWLFKWELKRSSRRLTMAENRATYDNVVASKTAKSTVLKMYRSCDMKKFTHWMSKQKCLADKVPIHLIWGQDDPHVPAHEGRLMRSTSLTVVENCGHWVPSEAPEEYAKILLGNDT